ncbi:MAG: glutamate-1-semialdehyde 2,1-aminomutase [Anaerolineae bacterium]|nr:aspartate aminotransferase family protein [Anaerolineales bacterium]MCQ3973337.1 aspartate aminotransferase family protein [Anaerolineae bacterium]
MVSLTKSNALFEAASTLLPLGVTSNFRYWGPTETRYIDRGKGAHLWDIDGNRYIDYRLGFGPVILGHSDDRVDDAVCEAIRHGQSFALGTPLEEEVARKITAMCPGVDMLRFTTTGTEATMHAIRLARAYTRREKIIMFEGQFHGLHDYVMFTSAIGGDVHSSRYSPVAIPVSSGIPEAVRNMVIMLPFNDLEDLEDEVDQSWHDVAAIIVEPILGNCGGILPEPGWLELIRRLCDENGIVMIMDEVKTGFRIARGGAQEHFGVTADLVTYAKALGNGYPIAAFGGKRDIMEQIGQGVSHGGTYTGNRVGLAAANATLDILAKTDALEVVAERGRELQTAITEVLERIGVPFSVSGHPSMFSFWFSEEAPKEYRDWLVSNRALHDQVASHLIERGVMPDPDSREPWFLSAAHSLQDIADTASLLEDTLREVLRSHAFAPKYAYA